MNNIQLTQSQQSAIAAFKEFLDGDEQVFMLKGAAGTGKTTLVTEFLKILEEQKREYGLMAPTGRAAYIIGSKTGKPAFTIHRSIYGLSKLKSTSQNKEDEDDGGMHLRFGLRGNNDSLKAVYIVDESSMVSDNFSENEAFSFGSGCLLTDLFEFTRGRKIVLVGDYAQLPPVGMNFSPALDKEYIETKFSCKVAEFMLREVMRQSDGSVMLSNASKIREAVERKSFIEFSLDKGNDSIPENTDLLAPYYRLFENKPSVKAAVITYSNKQALDYNLAIRRHYYGDTAPRLKAGDLLMICRNNYAYEYELFNGNIVLVEACQPDSEVTTRTVRVKLGKNRIEQVELRFRRATICFAVRGMRVSLNVMLLDNFLDDSSGSVGGLLARALIVYFNNRLPEKIKSRYNEIRRLLRSKDKLTIEQQELCDTYINLLNKDPYYNTVICKYGYAMTCHKAQGGEWENVFVDMCRFGGTANEDYFRWAYTALTRARKRVWHFRSPDFNYISNLVVEEIKPSADIKVSNYSGDGNFCDSRFERLTKLAMQNELSVSEDRSKQHQHIIKFTDKNGATATFQLWYKAKGYSAKDILLSSTSEEFTALCTLLIDASYAPVIVPFSAPDRPFAEKLVNFVKSQIDETGIQLLDITQEYYQDVFHLKTDGIAQIGLTYTAKGNYTYMRLTSSLGGLDTKLQALREKFL
ncbi:MAG: AAA family ATPase [Muribaculaceae bacterium]|nr:AAA family ATPase [Muribaculaceae bacterium]